MPATPESLRENISAPMRVARTVITGPYKGHISLVVIRVYSKWMDVMKSTTSAATTEKLREIHGLSENIVSDNGPTFIVPNSRIF